MKNDISKHLIKAGEVGVVSAIPELQERFGKIQETSEDTSLTQEFQNKPLILADILLARFHKQYTLDEYQNEKKKTMVVETYNVGNGKAFLKYPKGKDPNSALFYCINEFYPYFDRNVGAELTSIKELALLAGLARRVKKLGSGNGRKVIDSFDPRALRRFGERLDGGENIILDLEGFKLSAIKTALKSGRRKRTPVDIEISGSSSLLVKVRVGKDVTYRANPYIMAVAYGQTLQQIKAISKDPNIERVKQQGFFIAKKPTPQQRQTMKEPIQLVEIEIDRGYYHLKTGKTVRCFAVSRFRPYYETKEDRDFRRKFKNGLRVIQDKNGGDFFFTNQANGQGVRSKDRFMKYLLVDYKTYSPYLRKTELQRKFTKDLSSPKSDATTYTK